MRARMRAYILWFTWGSGIVLADHTRMRAYPASMLYIYHLCS
jgi:hypothetical protein